jgi:hypothetical protein
LLAGSGLEAGAVLKQAVDCGAACKEVLKKTNKKNREEKKERNKDVFYINQGF